MFGFAIPMMVGQKSGTLGIPNRNTTEASWDEIGMIVTPSTSTIYSK